MKAGFGNETTYRQAKKVVEKGSAALVKAMDTGEVKPSAAAKLADLPKPAQRKALRNGKQGIKAATRPTPKPISETLGAAFKELSERIDSIREQYGTITQMFKSKLWRGCDTYFIVEMIHELHKLLTELDKEVSDYENQHPKA